MLQVSQVTGYLVFINIITGASAVIPAMFIAPTTARHEAKQLMYHTTQVSFCILVSVFPVADRLALTYSDRGVSKGCEQ